MNTGSTPKPIGSRQNEVWLWYYMRFSGLLLTVLAFFHLWLNHVHTEVGSLSYHLVVERMRTFPLLRLTDFMLLLLGLSHGVNGLRHIIDDKVHDRATRAFWLGLLLLVFLVFMVAGTGVLWQLPAEGAA